jgi:hypothetical protein
MWQWLYAVIPAGPNLSIGCFQIGSCELREWGQWHEMDIFFWRYTHFKQYFLCMRWWFSRSFKSFHYPLQLWTFYWLLWNYLLILKMLTEPSSEFPFSVVGRCSLVPTSHWLQGKWSRINLSPVAFGIILQKS